MSAPTVTSLATEDTTPTISGTFDATNSTGGFAVTVNSITYTLGSNPELVTLGDNWFLTIPVADKLSVGTYDVAATATDSASNTLSDSTNNELTINPDTTAPDISSTSPNASATSVARTTTVSATFNEDIFATTVDASSFTLANSGSVSGTVSFDAMTNIAAFTPASSLSILTPYTATLSTAITDLSGNPLASDYSWSFTTEDGVWGMAGAIENDNSGEAWAPQIAFDANGNAIAVWYQNDGTYTNVMANRYVAGTGWGTPVAIDNSTNPASYPQVAVDAAGNAIAVWRQSDGTDNSIWANRYVAGTGWGTAGLLETDTGNAVSPQVAMDASGDAIAVWAQSDGTRNNIRACHYTAGTGWGTAGYLEMDSGMAAWPQVAVQASTGNALVVWQQHDGTEYSIYGNRYTAGTGWGGAGLIETNGTARARDPQVAVDANGNMMVVWFQDDGTALYNIWARYYSATSGWGAEQLIETDDTGNAEFPQVAFDGSGNAIAVWDQNNGSWDDVWANRYVPGTGWGTAEKIENQTLNAYIPQLAIDSYGNALAVWVQEDTTQSIRANRYVAGSGWQTDELIENDSGSAYGPQIAIDTNGNAIAVWEHNDGARSIWSNRLD